MSKWRERHAYVNGNKTIHKYGPLRSEVYTNNGKTLWLHSPNCSWCESWLSYLSYKLKGKS